MQRAQTNYWQTPTLQDVDFLHATYYRHRFVPHVHVDTYAIGVLTRGTELFHYRGKRHVAQPGAVIIVCPNELHDGFALNKDGWSYRMCYPHISVMRSAVDAVFGRNAPLPNFAQPIIDDPQMVYHMQQTLTLLEQQRSPAEEHDYFLEMLTMLVRRHGSNSAESNDVRREHKAALAAQHFIEAHFAQPITLNSLAAHVHLSPFHLSRVFKTTIGMPPARYLTQVRVENAKLALQAGHDLADVAHNIGFADQSHFTKRFKGIVGIPPGVYRQYWGR